MLICSESYYHTISTSQIIGFREDQRSENEMDQETGKLNQAYQH